MCGAHVESRATDGPAVAIVSTPRKRQLPDSTDNEAVAYKQSEASAAPTSSEDAVNNEEESEATEEERIPTRVNPFDIGQGPPVTFPPASESFATHEALYLILVKALIPTWGVSVVVRKRNSVGLPINFGCSRGNSHYAYKSRGCCRVRVRVKHLDGSCSTDYAKSHHLHNHGVAPELLRYPKWRPDLRRADVRKALGMGARGYSEKKEGVEQEGKGKKRAKVADGRQGQE